MPHAPPAFWYALSISIVTLTMAVAWGMFRGQQASLEVLGAKVQLSGVLQQQREAIDTLELAKARIDELEKELAGRPPASATTTPQPPKHQPTSVLLEQRLEKDLPKWRDLNTEQHQMLQQQLRMPSAGSGTQ